MKIKNRQQLLGIVAIAVVVLWAGDKLVFSPLVEGWKARTRQIVELKRSVSEGNRMLAREPDIRNEWEFMRSNMLSNEVSAAESQMLKTLERWKDASGISFSGKRPQWKKGDDDYMTLECRVDAAGDISALTHFLYEIERDPLGAKVDSVEITSRYPDGQQLKLGLLISGLQIKRSRP